MIRLHLPIADPAAGGSVIRLHPPIADPAAGRHLGQSQAAPARSAVRRPSL